MKKAKKQTIDQSIIKLIIKWKSQNSRALAFSISSNEPRIIRSILDFEKNNAKSASK
jgi:hypothetical protein